jgi:hypothetical protein
MTVKLLKKRALRKVMVTKRQNAAHSSDSDPVADVPYEPDLTVRVRGRAYGDPVKQMKEDARIAKLVAEEIPRAKGKARQIREIDGVSAKVVNLLLSGKSSIDHVTLVYETLGEEAEGKLGDPHVPQKLAKTLPKDKFYRLK